MLGRKLLASRGAARRVNRLVGLLVARCSLLGGWNFVVMDNVVLNLVCRGCLNLIRSLLKSSLASVLLAEMFDAWLYCDYD
jgi:hypothetical protein